LTIFKKKLYYQHSKKCHGLPSMYFTKAQMRALWFIIAIFACSVVFQYFKYYFFDREEYDFNEFDRQFFQKRDSLLASQKSSTPDTNVENSQDRPNSVVVYKRFPVNINSASEKDLQNLPRIGPAMAARIVLYRQEQGPFQTKDDLMKVKGIGKKTFEKLKDLITLK
jgi:comEA protein